MCAIIPAECFGHIPECLVWLDPMAVLFLDIWEKTLFLLTGQRASSFTTSSPESVVCFHNESHSELAEIEYQCSFDLDFPDG